MSDEKKEIRDDLLKNSKKLQMQNRVSRLKVQMTLKAFSTILTMIR